MMLKTRLAALTRRSALACTNEVGWRRLQTAAGLAAPLALVLIPELAHAQDMGGDLFASVTALLRGAAREVIGQWMLYIGALALAGTFIAGCLSRLSWGTVAICWVAIAGAFFSPKIVTGLRDMSGVMSF